MKRTLLLVLCALLAGLHVASFRDSGPLDDDFIHYRYARNLLAGEGLVYQPGERVEGFAAPLWILVLAAGMRLGVEPWTVSLLVSALCAALAAFAVGAFWNLRQEQNGSAAGRADPERAQAQGGSAWPIPALLLAGAPAFAFHGAAGLGTLLLAALLALWLWRYEAAVQADAPARGAALFLGLATLARAEAILFALFFLREERRRGRALPAWLAFTPLAAWWVFRWIYYGRFLPVPYLVKKLPWAADLGYGLRYLLESTWTAGVGLLLVLALSLLRGGRSAGPVVRAAALGFAAHVAYVVAVGGDYMPLARFFVPTLPLGLALGCLAAQRLLEARGAGSFARGACLGLALILSQVPQRQRAELRALHEQHEQRWIAVGRALARAVEPGTRVAVSAIGAIGYESGLELVDVLGLTNTAVLRAPPDLAIRMKGHHRHDAEYVLAREPDLVLPGNGLRTAEPPGFPVYLWERDLLEHEGLRSRYELMEMSVPGSYDLLLLVRSGSRRPLNARPLAGGR